MSKIVEFTLNDFIELQRDLCNIIERNDSTISEKSSKIINNPEMKEFIDLLKEKLECEIECDKLKERILDKQTELSKIVRFVDNE